MLFKNSVSVTLLALIVSCGKPTNDQVGSSVQGIRDYEEQHKIGAGYDTVSGDRRGDCVANSALEEPDFKGQVVNFEMTSITSSDSLRKSLNISASASLKSGVHKGSAKTNFFQSTSVDSYSTYVLVSAKVQNQSKEMRGVKLTQDAWDALALSPERFTQMCGDEFVSGYVTGGEYYAIVRISSSSEAEKKKVDAKIKYKNRAFKGQLELKAHIEELSKEHKVEILSFKRGGNGEQIAIDPETVVEQAVTLPALVAGDKAYIYETLFQKYTNLTLPPEKSPIDKALQQEVIEQLAVERASHMDILSDVQFIESNPEQFEKFDASKLNKQKNQIISNINLLNEKARLCFNDYRRCEIPKLDSAVVDRPVRRPQSKDVQRIVDEGYAWLRTSADVNGDSINDYCRFVGKAPDIFLSCAILDANGLTTDQYGFSSVKRIDTGYISLPMAMIDVNGDKRADFCRFVGDKPFLSCNLAGMEGFERDHHAYHSTWNVPIDQGYPKMKREFVDYNQDGFGDYCRYVGERPNIRYSCILGTATGFSVDQYALTEAPDKSADYNK
jgi:hypothetical protein